jgi:hypothetical protein
MVSLKIKQTKILENLFPNLGFIFFSLKMNKCIFTVSLKIIRLKVLCKNMQHQNATKNRMRLIQSNLMKLQFMKKRRQTPEPPT